MLILFCIPLSAASVRLETGGSYQWAGTRTIGEIDRSIWSADTIIYAELNEQISVGAGWKLGGILYQSSGHAFLHGPFIDLRYLFNDALYAGVQAAYVTIPGFRESKASQLSLYTGFSLRLGTRVTMNNELVLQSLFTAVPLYSAGVKNAISLSL
jgi:hypothetical protein